MSPGELTGAGFALRGVAGALSAIDAARVRTPLGRRFPLGRTRYAKRKPVVASGSARGLSGTPSGTSGRLNSRGAVSFGVSG
ncbi:hypothetical protein BH20ACT19_BH20ACT19_11480 [soil metagenome]